MPRKFKPGGKKFPPKSTLKPLPKQVDNHTAPLSSLAAPSGPDQEVENQLELELCWCIEQLQFSLGNGKLNENQAIVVRKTLNLLRNDSVAWIRKRQAMRNTFGDYRAKMIEDEKKYGKYLANFKFTTPKVDCSKSVFLRKAATVPAADKPCEEKSTNNEEPANKNIVKKSFIMSKETSDVPFTFNFSIPQPE